MAFKDFIRSVLIFFHLDITKNLEYDRLTKLIMKQNLSEDSNCIDVGCHKGEILDLMLKYAPKGKHYAFEPIPYLYNDLVDRFEGKAKIYPYALSYQDGNTTFQLVKNAPAYSGIKKRRYDISNPEIEEINVELKALDNLIPENVAVNFIKIDVEGAELGVLKGAKRIIQKNKPLIVFEFGLGGSDYYGTTPNDIFDLLVRQSGLKIYTLKAFINKEEPLSLQNLEEIFKSNREYYFVAA